MRWADAKAAAPRGAAGVRAGHVDQSEQSRAGWRTCDVGHGKRGGRGDRGHVWMEEFSGPLVRWRNDGEPRGLVGRGADAPGEENSRPPTASLHAHTDYPSFPSAAPNRADRF